MTTTKTKSKQTVEKTLSTVILALAAAFGGLAATEQLSNFIPGVTPDLSNPNIVITAPLNCRVGELVRIDTAGSVATNFAWKVIPDTANFIVIEDAQAAHFSGEEGGTYTFIVSGVCPGNTACISTFTITVDSSGITFPNPLDIPSELDEKVLSWLDRVKSLTKRDEANRIGENFRRTARRIRDGILGENPASYIDETYRGSRSSLGSQTESWAPFFEGLRMELNDRAVRGELSTPEEHTELWSEIGTILNRYSRS